MKRLLTSLGIVVLTAALVTLTMLVIVSPADAKHGPKPGHGKPTPGPTATRTATPTPTALPTLRPTATPSPTASPGLPTATPTVPTPTVRPTPTPTATPTPAPPPPGWLVVVDDQFDTGGLPAHWHSYDGPYGSGPHNCAVPGQSTVHDGILDMRLSWLPSGPCGASWYSAGLSLSGYSSVDARVTVRFRIVDAGASAHSIIPMRWPDDDSAWPAAGEEDYCEGSIPNCSSYLHYGSSNSQVSHDYSFDLSAWHVVTFERRNHAITATVDGALAWSFGGSSTTTPDTMKHVVLQQECHSACPSGTAGTEDIQIDYVRVEVPS